MTTARPGTAHDGHNFEDPDTVDAEATYHGIVYAKCHFCGYDSTNVTTLELWNDYGVQCPRAPEGDSHCPEAVTEWRMLDGRAAFVRMDGNGVTEHWEQPPGPSGAPVVSVPAYAHAAMGGTA